MVCEFDDKSTKHRLHNMVLEFNDIRNGEDKASCIAIEAGRS
jgi:hypothetical protein